MNFSPPNPYYSFSRFLKERYAEKVWKISVDAGFSCPNRDGHKGSMGCIFCRVDSFSKMESLQNIDVITQVRNGIENGKKKLGIKKYIVYFQASTNTYAPVPLLKKHFEEAISFPEVVGISIATRPDCLPDKVIELIEQLSLKLDVWVELGLQSSHDKTLKLLNRGHTFHDYLKAVEKLACLPVRLCTHIMLGLPGENRAMVQQTAERIATLPTHEVKLHPLLVLKDTPLAELFQAKEFVEIELREYAELVCDFIERMPPTMVIQRLTAEAPAHMLIAPLWALNKHIVRKTIEQEFMRRNSYQGIHYSQNNDS